MIATEQRAGWAAACSISRTDKLQDNAAIDLHRTRGWRWYLDEILALRMDCEKIWRNISRRHARRQFGGMFLAGLFFYLMFDRYLINPTVGTVVLIGLLGGFTTFSSFGLQTFTLLRDGEMGLALFNIAISNVAGLLMVWVGYSLAKIV
jgi:protein CrcB